MSKNTYNVGDVVTIKKQAISWGGKTNLRGQQVRIVNVGPVNNLTSEEYEVSPLHGGRAINQIFVANDFEDVEETVRARDLVKEDVIIGNDGAVLTITEVLPPLGDNVRLDTKEFGILRFKDSRELTIRRRTTVEFAVGTIIELAGSVFVKKTESAWYAISGVHEGGSYDARNDIERRARTEQYTVKFTPVS